MVFSIPQNQCYPGTSCTVVLIIFLLKVSTETLANTSPTGGSCGSDLNGPAVMDACQKVMARLEPYRTPQRQLFLL